MQLSSWKKWLVIGAVLLSAGTLAIGADLQSIMHDTQRVTKEGKRFTMIWWIPQIYWEYSLADVPSLTAEAKASVLKQLSAYNIIAVVDADFDEFGAIHPRTEEDVAATAVLTLNGKTIDRIPEAKLPDAMKNLLGGVRPVIQNGLGTFGKAMYMFIYPANTEAGAPTWEKSNGELSYALGEKKSKWRLPLASTLPVRHDAKTGEEFPGDFKYNPYTGELLK